MAETPVLVVAARSARLLAEGAARGGGWRVIALDCYGDADTRRAAARWESIASSDGAARIDAERTLAALAGAAREPGVIGWIAGSDFECAPELLARGAALLPLLGTAPDAVRRVRDPRGFFAALDALGLPHPETRYEPPAEPRGWLRKLARGSGGWHIRPAGDADHDHDDGAYFQRDVAGQPLSALFVATAAGARLIAVNAMIVRPLGAHHPHVWRGAIGPLALPDAQRADLQAVLDALVQAFALRGLASLDFVEDAAGRPWLLEINPRPPASMGLYPELPLLEAHVAACRGEPLPAFPPLHGEMRGSEIVLAREALVLSDDGARALAAAGDCHDLPAAGARFDAGDPVCSVSARAADAAAVAARLAARRQQLRAALAQTSPV